MKTKINTVRTQLLPLSNPLILEQLQSKLLPKKTYMEPEKGAIKTPERVEGLGFGMEFQVKLRKGTIP